MNLSHENVRGVLRTCGPLTSSEVTEFFPGSTQQAVAAVLSSLRHLAKRQVHIAGWTREPINGRPYLRAMYALGDKPDAYKPRAMSNLEVVKRYKAKKALGRGVPNSVFAPGALG